ncbi:GerMN domain-containing protein [Tessaracoccus caeni]|uniref:GerMN domain-containing protein n=1 Tax=Tessaracoccus caeni TaxID=3031239 RepID=UPI0023DBD7CA|nr:GerMN domain-containing protein [Tessaracoccus caeni]MDF1488441.1 LpqB family beta-propeller domain-containing protein [Tessaracoccus caeni]
MSAKRRIVVAVSLALLLGAGCAELPTSGPVEQIEMVLKPPSVDIAPEPPSEDMTPEQLIDGFLLAMADPESDYAVARQYLTAQAEAQWQPTSGAVIYDGELAGDVPALEGDLIGRLDAQGRYHPEAGSLKHDFDIRRVDGQWRIDEPPSGLLLSRFVFERYYSRMTTYFISREGTHVVPDLTYQPESLVTPQRVVETQVLGPPAELVPAVTNALGSGVELGSEGATINSEGVVVVDLIGLPGDLTEEERRRVGAQLLWSLTAVARTTGLKITSDGRPFDLPGQRADGVLELSAQQGYQVLNRATAPDLYAVADGSLGVVTSNRRLEPLYEDLPSVAELAVSLDATLAALVQDDRQTLLLGTPKGRFTPIDHAYRNLRRPQFVQGELWVLADTVDGDTVVLVVNAQGDTSSMRIDLPDGHRLVSIAAAQNGARAAVITEAEGGTQLGMMTVSVGERRSVSRWRALKPVNAAGVSLTGIRDVDWQGETTLALVASTGGPVSVFLTQYDGSAVEDLVPPIERIVELTALPMRGGGAVAVRALDDGAVWRYETRSRWMLVVDSAEVIAYAG